MPDGSAEKVAYSAFAATFREVVTGWDLDFDLPNTHTHIYIII